MAQNDLFRRYLDAGLELTALTQAKAEALVGDLVKAGEVQADQARDAVTDLLERSRKSSERLLETVRSEVKTQIEKLGLARKEDLDPAEPPILRLFLPGPVAPTSTPPPFPPPPLPPLPPSAHP